MVLSQALAAEVVKLYYSTSSPVTVIREMAKRYPDQERLNKLQIRRIVTRFEQTGSVADKRHTNPGRPKSVRSEENIVQVRAAVEETPQRSVRKILGDISNQVSRTSAHRILRYDLKLTPYTLSVRQHLKDSDIESRLRFAHWMNENENIADILWFSDEAHFYSNAQVNKKNCRYWSTEKPDFYLEKTLHSEKVTVWAALSANGIIGPFFFEDENGDVETINSVRYLDLLKRKFLPALRRKGISIPDMWFQQDGATPHTAVIVTDWLHKTFGDKLISFRTNNAWPPHSPDLSPLDFFLWGHLKDRVYKPSPKTLDELKTNIRHEINQIDVETCRSVVRNFKKRLNVVIAQNGRHVEHVL